MHNSTSYSIHGQLTNEVQNGVVLSRTYDSLNRPTGYRLMQNAECRMQNDGGGNLANLVNPVEVSYSYDSLGRFASVTAPGGTRFVASANLSTLQPFNLSTFAYLNDALGRRVEVTRTGAVITINCKAQ
jgi:uncharacterized protein RhaS with RHS repeats